MQFSPESYPAGYTNDPTPWCKSVQKAILLATQMIQHPDASQSRKLPCWLHKWSNTLMQFSPESYPAGYTNDPTPWCKSVHKGTLLATQMIQHPDVIQAMKPHCWLHKWSNTLMQFSPQSHTADYTNDPTVWCNSVQKATLLTTQMIQHPDAIQSRKLPCWLHKWSNTLMQFSPESYPAGYNNDPTPWCNSVQKATLLATQMIQHPDASQSRKLSCWLHKWSNTLMQVSPESYPAGYTNDPTPWCNSVQKATLLATQMIQHPDASQSTKVHCWLHKWSNILM